ncbi:MAG: hypothetical protein U0U70_15695 [Chitinophagaceae bacterium]
MLSRSILSRLIIFGFMILVGFALAMAIYYKSFMGVSLALVSLGAGVYFIYLMGKAKREIQEAEEIA